MPGMARWAEWCYGRPSKLFFDGVVIKSEVGVQQGDPIGPLLFALALQPVVIKLGNIPGLDISFSYLAVAAGIALLKTSSAPLG